MNIFITGGTSGIGLALAKLYHSSGHNVAVSGRRDFQNNDLVFYQFDVTDNQAFAQAVDSFVQKFGSIDLMIANAGISMKSKTRNHDFDDIKQVMDVNIIGVLNSFEHALRFMKQQSHGHIVAISSVAGFVGLPGTGAYSGAKAAVIKFCESMAIDLIKTGISVTCVCPGFIDTPLTKRNPHPMPFLMSSDKAAKIISSAISRKKALLVFPFRMRMIITTLEIMPRFLYRFIMTFKAFNYSRGK